MSRPLSTRRSNWFTGTGRGNRVVTVQRQLHYRSGSTISRPWSLEITTARAGWTWTSMRAIELGAGQAVTFDTGDEEMVILSLEGSVQVESDDEGALVEGRADVFSGVSDFVYLPRHRTVRLSSERGGRFALPGAQASSSRHFVYQPKSAIQVEYRGSGSSSRRVVNFCTTETFDAERLIACEVVTPGGNWSSYPPHKHDEEREGESQLEEIYYFEFDVQSHQGAMGYQRVYGTPERPIDVLTEVRNGDVVLIPHGWHGPTMAAPGYDLYFLNSMAGPGPRAWNICDDPAHAWVRSTWTELEFDPRALAPR